MEQDDRFKEMKEQVCAISILVLTKTETEIAQIIFLSNVLMLWPCKYICITSSSHRRLLVHSCVHSKNKRTHICAFTK